MDRKNLHLVIISPERTLFDGPVNWVRLKITGGFVEVKDNLVSVCVEL